MTVMVHNFHPCANPQPQGFWDGGNSWKIRFAPPQAGLIVCTAHFMFILCYLYICMQINYIGVWTFFTGSSLPNDIGLHVTGDSLAKLVRLVNKVMYIPTICPS